MKKKKAFETLPGKLPESSPFNAPRVKCKLLKTFCSFKSDNSLRQPFHTRFCYLTAKGQSFFFRKCFVVTYFISSFFCFSFEFPRTIIWWICTHSCGESIALLSKKILWKWFQLKFDIQSLSAQSTCWWNLKTKEKFFVFNASNFFPLSLEQKQKN